MEWLDTPTESVDISYSRFLKMPRLKKKFGEGRYPTKFSFTYEDFAQALGCSIDAARKHAQRGNFDPNDLMSILEFIQIRLSKIDDLKLEDKKEKQQKDGR